MEEIKEIYNDIEKNVFIEKLPEEEKKYMDLKNFDSVVVIESHTYLSNGTLFQYGINSYRPDKFAFSTVAKR